MSKGWHRNREFWGCSWLASWAGKPRASGEQCSSGSDPVQWREVCRRGSGPFNEAGLSRNDQVQRQSVPELIFHLTKHASVVQYFFH